MTISHVKQFFVQQHKWLINLAAISILVLVWSALVLVIGSFQTLQQVRHSTEHASLKDQDVSSIGTEQGKMRAKRLDILDRYELDGRHMDMHREVPRRQGVFESTRKVMA